jgi:hypothetical protein
MNVIQSASIYRQALASESSYAPSEPDAPAPSGPSSDDGKPLQEGRYELVVEGEKVFETENSEELFDTIGQKTKEGDRFEVFLNGRSLGLKIRTTGGIISVPTEAVEKVRAMTHGEVRSMVARAAAAAKGEGAPEKAAGGIPWWLIAGGAAAAIAAVV